MQYNDKHKDKIKKLLELSMSDNENEANIALKQAMSLMNKHNLTKEEVYGQKMISKTIETPYTRIPFWYNHLYADMAKLSGCIAIYSNGYSETRTKATIRIAGRQRDVENTVYLVVFLSRELERNVKNYKSKLLVGKAKNTRALVNSYRLGFSKNIFKRMQECRNQFFTDHNNHNQIVCIDHQHRISEAETFYRKEHGSFVKGESSSAGNLDGFKAGASDANQLQINNAVNRQNHIYGIGHN